MEELVKRFKWTIEINFYGKDSSLEDVIENFIQDLEKEIFKSQHVLTISDQLIKEGKLDEFEEMNQRKEEKLKSSNCRSSKIRVKGTSGTS